MGKKKERAEGEERDTKEREGHMLLGLPKFKKLENGRFKCVETGHEVPNAQAKLAYAGTKHCRIGLIDAALSRNKPPLNMFRQDPASHSKLICQLTGDTINKSEEHIWKHINGRRFLNFLEKKEAENQTGVELVEEEKKPKSKPKPDSLEKKKKKNKKNKEKDKIGEAMTEMMCSSDGCESEKADFWVPPVGERWDMDGGGDRWGSGSGSGSDSDSDAALEPGDEVANGAGDAADDSKDDTVELSKRTKRMSIEIEPSSFASRKKKKNKTEAEW